MDAHVLLSPVGQKTETRFNCFLTENRKSTEMVGTPSTVRKLLPPPTGRSPSLKEGGLGAARALSKILIQLRVQGRNPGRFNGGYGVPRGFKGERSKSPPNPLGSAERVPRIAHRQCFTLRVFQYISPDTVSSTCPRSAATRISPHLPRIAATAGHTPA